MDIGASELFIILVIVLLIFGPGRIVKVSRDGALLRGGDHHGAAQPIEGIVFGTCEKVTDRLQPVPNRDDGYGETEQNSKEKDNIAQGV